MGTLTSTGYNRQRLADFLDSIKTSYQEIFGENIDLSGDSQDGQIVAILAEMFSDIDQNVEGVYKSFDPSQSQGSALSSLVQLNGITRLYATFSTVEITVTGTNGTIIEAGKTIKTNDAESSVFVIDSDITISGGVGTGTATAENSGAVYANSGTLTVIDTPVTGWVSVTNNSDAVLGRDEESDTDLRIRRRKSVAISARNVIDTIYAKLLTVDNVIAAKVIENIEDEYDSDTGIRAHGIRCIVQGGADEDIANVIFNDKTCGSPTEGATTVGVLNSQGQTVDINFDRPNGIPIYIKIVRTKLASYPVDGDDLVKQAIVDYFEDEETALTIGDSVYISEINRPIYRIDGIRVTGLYIDIAEPVIGATDIEINFDSLALFDTSRIVIEDTQ